MNGAAPERDGDQAAASFDLALVARDAVVSFLRDASGAVADQEGVALPSPEPAAAELRLAGAEAAAAGDSTPAQSAFRVAAFGIATLDRIEAEAERLEADIAAARREQAEIRDRAGTAAENAVRSAQDAAVSAGSAAQASERAGARVRLIGGYTVVVAALVVVQLLILLLFAVTTH